MNASVHGELLTKAGMPALLAGRWHARLLGGLEASNGDLTITHFVSHPIAALFARLALYPNRSHPREELVELLWPGVDIDAGRNRLRHAISTLRRLLEPPGTLSGSALQADRQSVRIHAEALSCDALDFERCMRDGDPAQALALYRGELLPGFYEDWVQVERARLATMYERLSGGEAILPVDGAAPPMPPGRRSPAPRHADPAGTNPGGADAATPESTSPRAADAVFGQPPLPAYLTRLVGREHELRRLLDTVHADRLVTLSGIGGCGKTRLAVEVARHTGAFGLVAFVALAECTTPGRSADQIRAAMQLPAGHQDSLTQVIQSLGDRHALLVLDNFEQLVDAGGGHLVRALLDGAPRLHVLATSRRILGLEGEQEFALSPLPQPDPLGSLEQVAINPSVALFVDRARKVRPDFQVTSRNREALARLCCALEGVPLAIELAASRSRAFSPQDMHAALSSRFSLLARAAPRGARTAGRHDSLHAAIDWSWQLLQPRQQQFLAALSVFRGGWTVEVARAVCEADDAAEQLETLAADSLLRSEDSNADAGPDSLRFFMLEMIREFLVEQLPPGQALALRARHRAHYLALVEASGRIDEPELANLHEALRSAVDDGQPATALHLALGLRERWDSIGIAPDALDSLRRALAACPLDEPRLVSACTMVALLLLKGGDGHAAQVLADRALTLASDHPAQRAAALCTAVRIEIDLRHSADGMPRLQEARDLAARAGARDIEARALVLMGSITLRVLHEGDRAEALLAQAWRMQVDAGLLHDASNTQYERVLCMRETGRRREALRQAQAIETQCMDEGDLQRALGIINLQGVIHAELREWAAALRCYRRCADLAWQTHNQYWLGFALWNHGRNLARLREPELAATLMAFAEHYWINHFGALDAQDRGFVRRVRRLAVAQIGFGKTAVAWERGRRLPVQQALAMALSLPLSHPAVQPPDEAVAA